MCLQGTEVHDIVALMLHVQRGKSSRMYSVDDECGEDTCTNHISAARELVRALRHPTGIDEEGRER